MAYVVAKHLHLRPLDILKGWKCEELLVCFGYYMNEQAHTEYEKFKHLDAKAKQTIKDKPQPYVFKFFTFEQLSTSQVINSIDINDQVEAFMKGGGFIGG